MIVAIINLRFGVGWMSDRNGARRGAASRGTAPHLGTLCLEVQITKNACATQSHARAWNDKFIYILPNFASTAGLILLGGWAFFDRLGGWKKRKDTAIPPGHRRILKKGDFITPSVFSFFEKKTAAWNLLFQNRRKATAFCFGAWVFGRHNNGFLYAVIAENTYSLISFLVCLTSTTILEIPR